MPVLASRAFYITADRGLCESWEMFHQSQSIMGWTESHIKLSVTPSMPHFYCSARIHWHPPQYLSEQMFLFIWAAWFWLWQQITTYLVPLNISLIKEEYKLLKNFTDCKSAHTCHILYIFIMSYVLISQKTVVDMTVFLLMWEKRHIASVYCKHIL